MIILIIKSPSWYPHPFFELPCLASAEAHFQLPLRMDQQLLAGNLPVLAGSCWGITNTAVTSGQSGVRLRLYHGDPFLHYLRTVYLHTGERPETMHEVLLKCICSMRLRRGAPWEWIWITWYASKIVPPSGGVHARCGHRPGLRNLKQILPLRLIRFAVFPWSHEACSKHLRRDIRLANRLSTIIAGSW